MKEKKFNKEMQMLRLAYAMAQQLSNSSTSSNEADSTEQGSDLGTLEKKRRESNRIAAQRVQNASYNEMRQEYDMKLLRQQNGELSKRVGRLEKQLAKVESKMTEYSDMEFRISWEIDRKTKCIPKLRKKISKQGKEIAKYEEVLSKQEEVIKQMGRIFLAVAVQNEVVTKDVIFSKMMKKLEKAINNGLLRLPDNRQ